MEALVKNVQYIMDERGKKTAVVVPIEAWDDLLSSLDGKELFAEEIKQSFRELKLAKAGELKLRLAQELLDEL